MSSPNHSPDFLSGTLEDRHAFNTQLEAVYKKKGLALLGSVGRQALYATYNWGVPPLSLKDATGNYRDIDVARTRGTTCLQDIEGPYPMDGELADILSSHRPQPALDGYLCPSIPIDPKVIRRQTRMLDGNAVYTFQLGTQWHIEAWLEASRKADYRISSGMDGLKDPAHYDESYRVFTEFTDAMRSQQPQEFLPDKYYEPFRQAISYYDSITGPGSPA